MEQTGGLDARGSECILSRDEDPTRFPTEPYNSMRDRAPILIDDPDRTPLFLKGLVGFVWVRGRDLRTG